MVSENNTKLVWKTICVSMRQIKILLDFFKLASVDNLGIKNLYGKVDYYNDQKQIL